MKYGRLNLLIESVKSSSGNNKTRNIFQRRLQRALAITKAHLRRCYHACRKSNLFLKVDKAVACGWNFWICECNSYIHVARSLIPQWNQSKTLIHRLIYFHWYNQWLFHWFRFRECIVLCPIWKVIRIICIVLGTIHVLIQPICIFYRLQ